MCVHRLVAEENRPQFWRSDSGKNNYIVTMAFQVVSLVSLVVRDRATVVTTSFSEVRKTVPASLGLQDALGPHAQSLPPKYGPRVHTI
jgi:hypothetical protein